MMNAISQWWRKAAIHYKILGDRNIKEGSELLGEFNENNAFFSTSYSWVNNILALLRYFWVLFVLY